MSVEKQSSTSTVLLCKDKMWYLLTYILSRYCLLSLHYSTVRGTLTTVHHCHFNVSEWGSNWAILAPSLDAFVSGTVSNPSGEIWYCKKWDNQIHMVHKYTITINNVNKYVQRHMTFSLNKNDNYTTWFLDSLIKWQADRHLGIKGSDLSLYSVADTTL